MNENPNSVHLSTFQHEIDSYRVKIDNAILTELNQRRNSIFYNPLIKALKGGKRLRPILLVLSSESMSKKQIDPLPATVAVELAHTESLIHDDIIDRDFLRRETTTFHTIYGNEMALLSADFILSMILEITSRYSDHRIAYTLACATSEMCEGELEELIACKNTQRLSEDEYIKIVSKKTASLFEASTKIGALIAGAQSDEVKALSDYGRFLGIAYQIQDDIADLKKTTGINILKLLDADSHPIKTFHEIAKSYIFEATQKLEKLKPSAAKALLIKLADSVTSQAIARI
jgi:octaprenyl-diphosphate synthase